MPKEPREATADFELPENAFGQLTLHSCARALPPMTPSEYAELRADIQRSGQKEPIIIDVHNRIVDGVHRYKACIELGVEPLIDQRELSDAEAWSLSFSLNVIRRHMSETQRAAACALARQSEDFPLTQAALAKMFKVSDRLVRFAERVLEASPELFEMLTADELTVHGASELLSLPPEQRDDAIKRIKSSAPARTKQKVKARRESQPTTATHWRKKHTDPWHAAYAPLFAAADELPQLLVDHPLPGEHVEELREALQQALVLLESAASPADFSSREDPSVTA